MNYLYSILLIIVLYVYISYYYRYPSVAKVLHVYKDEFHSQLFLEKQPIIILENKDTLDIFKKNTTPYLISKVPLFSSEKIWKRNSYKYLYIQPKTSTEVHLLHPSKSLGKDKQPLPDETLITLQLNENHILIVPFHWYYYSEKECNMLGIHDYLSWLLP